MRPKIALAQPFHDFRVSGLELKRALEALGGFTGLSGVKVSASQSEVRFEVFRLSFQYPEVDRNRLFEMLGSLQLLRAPQLTLHIPRTAPCGCGKQTGQGEYEPEPVLHRLLSEPQADQCELRAPVAHCDGRTQDESRRTNSQNTTQVQRPQRALRYCPPRPPAVLSAPSWPPWRGASQYSNLPSFTRAIVTGEMLFRV